MARTSEATELHFDTLLKLIDMERDAEKDENKRELERFPLHVREALGKTVTRLQIEGDDEGVGGLPLLILSKAPPVKMTRGRGGSYEETGGLSPFHAMNQGDNVLLTYPASSNLPPVDGALYDVDDYRVTVAINGPVPDPLPAGNCQIDLLGSDATYKRMRQAVNTVKRTEKAALSLLRDVTLGEKKASAEDEPEIQLFNARLNEYQIQAVKRCLAANEAAIIHGPPGTGKTTVLVEVILQTVKRGGRVLASAPSNIAVDNMVEKLLNWDLRIVRMGHPARILEPLRHVTLTALEEGHELRDEIRRMDAERHRLQVQLRRKEDRPRGRDEWEDKQQMRAEIKALQEQARDNEFSIRREIIENAQVVLATHGGTNSMLGRQKFDLVIMDEASQATEPLSWIPIVLAKKVVFAGDSCQLPPTIYSKPAAEQGLAVTLFDRLMKVLPPNMQTLLRVQYRMHQTIMEFSSKQFYEGKLIADATVRDHTAAELPRVERTELTESPMVFIDTAGTGYEEAWNELLESRENDGEARLALRVFEKLCALGVDSAQMAIITPYVAQVKKLRSMCSDPDVEIGSVDSFQGREKEVVILSLVRSNETGEVGFLADTRRMNVGMTRARRLLVVIGDSATICRHPFYAKFIDYVDEKDAHSSAWEWMND